MRTALLSAVLLVACGPRTHVADAGPDDAGIDSGVPDAGRTKGQDPPTGWTVALPIPADAGTGSRYGVGSVMVLDQFNQPMIAAFVIDPNNDGVFDDNRLVFTRWDGVGQKYQDPVTVEIVGDIDVSHPNRQISMAREQTTGEISIAYPNSSGAIRRAWSDDEGGHFSQETVSGSPMDNGTKSNPVVATHGMQLDVAYVAGGQIVHRTRMGMGSFTDNAVGASVPDGPMSMALTATGAAGIAYFSTDSDGGFTLSYSEGGGAPATIDSSMAVQDKAPSVTLDINGAGPQVAYHLASDTNADGQLWYSKSTGGTWSTPVAMPRNGPTGMLDGTQWYQAVVIDQAGKTAVVGNFQNRSAATAVMCGGPKLGTSMDGTTWTVCHPPETGGTLVHTFDFAGWWLTMAVHKPGKLTIAFDYETRTNPMLLGGGVVVYREP